MVSIELRKVQAVANAKSKTNLIATAWVLTKATSADMPEICTDDEQRFKAHIWGQNAHLFEKEGMSRAEYDMVAMRDSARICKRILTDKVKATERDSEIVHLKDVIAKNEEDIKDLKGMLTYKEEVIDSLDKEFEILDGSLRSGELVIRGLHADTMQAHGMVKELQGKLDDARARENLRVAALEEKIKKLEDQIVRLESEYNSINHKYSEECESKRCVHVCMLAREYEFRNVMCAKNLTLFHALHRRLIQEGQEVLVMVCKRKVIDRPSSLKNLADHIRTYGEGYFDTSVSLSKRQRTDAVQQGGPSIDGS
jgi:hypothetical protein